MNERTKGIVRLVTVLILLLNGFLSAMGKSPISNENAYVYVSEALSAISAGWAWWKNNNMTESAQRAQKLLERFKRENGR